MSWYCVHIEHMRVAKAENITFRNMLIEEYQKHGSPRDCHVYLKSAGGYFYYFSPAASEALGVFMRFWEGYGVPEPSQWHQMERVI